MEEVILVKSEKNRKFGIEEADFTEEQKEILKRFAKWVKENNIKSDVSVTIQGFDRYKVINRINIYIKNEKFNIILKNVYCGGLWGADRIFQVLYSFEYLLSDLGGEEFGHYEQYSLSNGYKLL